jgi:hypothetical protein
VGRILSEDIIAQTAQFASVARHARPLLAGENRVLQFLIRDWENTETESRDDDELRNTWKTAAEEYTKEVLLSAKEVVEVEQSRQALKGCFSEMTVALLPHPGLKVTRPEFEESALFDKADPQFQVLMTSLCKHILSRASSLEPKPTGREVFYQLLEGCKALEESEIVVEPLFIATARANGAYALDQAQRAFLNAFGYQFDRFEDSLREAMRVFRSIARFGPESIREEFRDELVEFMEASLDRVRAINRQQRLRRTRMKQAAFVIVTGAVLAPWWIPAALSMAVRLGFNVTSKAAFAIVSPETAAVVAVTSLAVFASTWWLRGGTVEVPEGKDRTL